MRMRRVERTRLRRLLSVVQATGALLASSAVANWAQAAGGAPTTQDIPFKLEVVEVANSAMPAVHSYCSGHSGDKWLILGGRSAGLHGLGSGNNNFAPRRRIRCAYVIDPLHNKMIASVDLVQSLPPKLAGPLTATNAEFVQIGGHLIIVGGYGQDLTTNTLTTFGTLTDVLIDNMITAIESGGANLAPCMTESPSPDDRLRVSGGALRYGSDGYMYLACGQNFTGIYTLNNYDYNAAHGLFQKYNERVGRFTLNQSSINQFEGFSPGNDSSQPYHRRDFAVADIIEKDGKTPGFCIYGGVFKAGQVAGLTAPIEVAYGATPTVTVQTGFQQALNHYDCANVTVFDAASSSSFTALFGGISQYHYDAATNTLVLDQQNLKKGIDGLPFINSISTIQHKPGAGDFAQFIQPESLPALVGADSQFLASGKLLGTDAFYSNGVVNLAKLTGRTLVGHIVGGIESFGPYSTLVTQNPSTVASKRLFQVWITPGPSAVIVMPPLPTTTTPVTVGESRRPGVKDRALDRAAR